MNGQQILYKIPFNPRYSKDIIYGTYGYMETSQIDVFPSDHKYILQVDNSIISRLIINKIRSLINHLRK